MATLAHDLRNRLAPIRTAVKVLHRLRAPHPVQTQAFDILHRQVMQMSRLLDDLLNAPRITSGKVTLQRRPVALRDVVDQAIETCRPPIESRRQVAFGPDTGRADPRRWRPGALGPDVRQLAEQRREVRPGRGAVTLTAQAHSDSVVLRVIDTGHGIATELLPEVFDLFTQGPNPLDHARGGLRIGLAVAREITRLHGGTIEARSDGSSSGSELVVTLPRYLPGSKP